VTSTRSSIALLFLCAACSRVQRAGEGGGAVLMRNLLRVQAVEIVADAGPVQEACRAAADRIARERGVSCRVLSPGEPGDPRAARIVLTGPWDPAAVLRLGILGVQVDANAQRPSFTFRRAQFAGRSDALTAVIEDPDRPGLPLTIYYANGAGILERCAPDVEPGWKPWVRIYRAGARALEGPLAADGSIVENRLVDVDAVRARELAAYVAGPARPDGIQSRAAPDVDPALRDAYLDAVARARAETVRWAGTFDAQKTPGIVLHAEAACLAACVQTSGLSAWNPVRNEVQALVARGVPHDSGLAAARAVAEAILGPPAAAWLADGAAVHGAGAWWGTGLTDWIAWLRLGGLAPGVAALVDPQAAETNSPHLIRPLRGALFRFLLESRGEGAVRALWTGDSKLAVDTELDRAFTAWLDDLAGPHRAAFESRRATRRASLLADSFLSAVGIEEPGRSARRGLASAAYRETLAEARALGAKAAALTCFVVAERDPVDVPVLLEGERLLEPVESDARVFAGLCQARESGMRTLLLPHLLTAPAGTLAGTGPQGDENGWRRFFDAYTRFVVHVGLLSELAGVDGLAIGGGMPGATSGRDDGRAASARILGWRREGWTRVLRAVRGAFSGAITWTADSRIEAADLLFWSDLDVVACDLETELEDREITLDPKPGTTLEKRISGQLFALELIAKKSGKPLILTQAGFRSGAPRPGEARDARFADDPGLQAFEIDVLSRAVRTAREAGSLRGIVLWRWSTDPADRGVNGRDRVLRPGAARDAVARALAGL
jgi:hypothetical protein